MSSLHILQQQGPYFIYLCAKFAHLGWHVGLKKNGKPKPGKRTGHGQKAMQFIPLPIVPVTPNFEKVLDLTQQQEKMAFIDEDLDEELRRGPKQVQKIE